MQNIFNSGDYQALVRRIESLQVNSVRKWGSMNIEQMLEHCGLQLKLALGKVASTKTEGPALYRVTLVKKIVLYVMPWIRGLPTPSKMNMHKNSIEANVFTNNKSALLGLLTEVLTHDEFNAHPFFGVMNRKDWGRMIWKHLDHHLKQFSA